jgi:beta-galactosidase
MVPHAGADSRVWREVVALGADLKALADVAGSRVESDVAIVWDWPAWWAVELDSHPSVDVRYLNLVTETYDALWRLDVTIDFVRPGADLSAYKLVVIPSLYLVSDEAAANLRSYVERGGHLVCHFFSGIVDPDDAIRLGGYPGAFRELLGVRVEEFYPLLEGVSVSLSDGGTGRIWTELLDLAGAQAVATYLDGPLPGAPAITRHDVGGGVAYYVTTALDADTNERLLGSICGNAAVTTRDTTIGPIMPAAGIETVRRRGDNASYLFIINHTDREVDVTATGDDMLSGMPIAGTLKLSAGDVAVIREGAPASATARGTR